MLTAILLFIVILSLIVFVHELGHFLVARKFGVKALEFGFGLPPRAAGIVKNDEGKWEYVSAKSKKEYKNTILSLNWIPVGGFVQLKGEAGDEEVIEPDSFNAKAIWKRISILSAGVIMNVIFAAVVLAVGFMVGLPSVIEDLPANARVSDPHIQVFSVLDGSPADEAGFEAGDIILGVNGVQYTTTEELQSVIKQNPGTPIEISILRRGEEMSLLVTPEALEQAGNVAIGVGLGDVGIVSYPPHVAVLKGAESTVLLTGAVIYAFYDLFKNIIVHQEVSVDLSGPVGIAVMTGQVARMGLSYILQFTAVLSINLAIINFLPFPGLDGGRVLFLTIEKIRRKPMPSKVEAAIHNAGFIALLALLALVTFRDIAKVSDKIIDSFKSLIS